MKNICDILMCPECSVSLTDALECTGCGKKYFRRHGVYNLISLDLSGNQDYLNRIDIPDGEDEMTALFNDIFPGTLSDEELSKAYYAHFNEETLEAEKKWYEYTRKLLGSLSGDVCDLATGGGTMLQNLIDSNNEDINIVCADINELELICTRRRRNGDRRNIFYIATDGRQLSLKADSFDYVVSLAGFGNIPEGDRVARELYRILKPGGKIIMQDSYIDKDSKSYELAKQVGVERGLVEEFILGDLRQAGFENITSTIVAEAVWAENPDDLIPAAGDIQRYCVIQAQK